MAAPPLNRRAALKAAQIFVQHALMGDVLIDDCDSAMGFRDDERIHRLPDHAKPFNQFAEWIASGITARHKRGHRLGYRFLQGKLG